jgi:hypothetical protein
VRLAWASSAVDLATRRPRTAICSKAWTIRSGTEVPCPRLTPDLA